MIPALARLSSSINNNLQDCWEALTRKIWRDRARHPGLHTHVCVHDSNKIQKYPSYFSYQFSQGCKLSLHRVGLVGPWWASAWACCSLDRLVCSPKCMHWSTGLSGFHRWLTQNARSLRDIWRHIQSQTEVWKLRIQVFQFHSKFFSTGGKSFSEEADI